MKSHHVSSPALAALIASLILPLAAHATDVKIVRTAHGDVAVANAPKTLSLAKGALPAPFATAQQRAAVKPLLWAEAKAETFKPEPQVRVMGPAARSEGGSAPSFANYQARNQFAEAWKAVDALEAKQGNRISQAGDVEAQDGAHYGYTRFPGNYYTSQWTAAPWNKIGKLYFTKPDGSSSYCTANVVSGNSVLATAAHCVYTRGAGFNSNFVFVPAERYGVAPYGSYRWAQATVPSQWLSNGGRRWDLGLIRLTGEVSTGQPVTNYVGWLGRAWNQGYSQFMYSIGYSADMSTQYTNICAGQTYSSANEGTNVLVQGCDMTYGSSGGGWLMNYTPNSHGGNQVNSVVSGPHIGAFGSAYVGARFNDDNLIPLCNVVGC